MPNAASRFRDWGPLERAFADGLHASCEALYPSTDSDAPDWEDTDLVRRTASYVDGLPPDQRRLLKLLFIGVELLSLLLAPLRRFSRRPLAVRTRAIARWRASGILPLRLLGDALKSAVQMVYLSHPAVVRYAGEYKVWAHPADTFEIDVRGTADMEAS